MKAIWLSLILVVPAFIGSFLLGLPQLGVVVILLWLLFGAILAMKMAVKTRIDDPRDEMDPESRSLYAPIRRLTDEIEEIVARHSGSAIMTVVGGEASQEARRIRDQIGKALSARSDLRKAIREKNLAQLEAERLKEKAAAAASAEDKVTILSALEAKQLEMTHYAEVEKVISKIDSGTAQAQAALSEMKARLSVKSASERSEGAAEESDLRENISRLKSLSVSYDEAEELLRQ
jgi:hypothetical protein